MQLHREIDAIHATGAEVFVIGNGSPSFIEGFREHTKWAGPIYTDPALAVYKAAELKRSVMRTIDPRGIGKGIGAFLRGARQGAIQGDAWQQGGVLVVAPSGEILWHHVSGRPDDTATAPEIIAALGGVDRIAGAR
ncbi:MAG: AhpC/TSA family protein [Deltaproteobacteria bacterium]|nr:AhpC/TSA family protein [Deltaproteobacteria bacterium]